MVAVLLGTVLITPSTGDLYCTCQTSKFPAVIDKGRGGIGNTTITARYLCHALHHKYFMHAVIV